MFPCNTVFRTSHRPAPKASLLCPRRVSHSAPGAAQLGSRTPQTVLQHITNIEDHSYLHSPVSGLSLHISALS
eukprot:8392487-Pyramimonas_sp.AAC.1